MALAFTPMSNKTRRKRRREAEKNYRIRAKEIETARGFSLAKQGRKLSAQYGAGSPSMINAQANRRQSIAEYGGGATAARPYQLKIGVGDTASKDFREVDLSGVVPGTKGTKGTKVIAAELENQLTKDLRENYFGKGGGGAKPGFPVDVIGKANTAKPEYPMVKKSGLGYTPLGYTPEGKLQPGRSLMADEFAAFMGRKIGKRGKRTLDIMGAGGTVPYGF